MTRIDIGTSLDELLSLSPTSVHDAYAGAVTVLQEHASRHHVVVGPRMPDISSDLDEDQRRVIACADPTVRLIAPAGAGKTHCIVNRLLAHLRGGTAAGRLLLVTFDNNSANELRGRVSDLLGAQQGPTISTLNAYGRSLLSQYAWNGRAPRLINESPRFQQKLIKDLLERVLQKSAQVKAVLPTGVKRTYYLQLFSYFKNQMYSPRLPSGPQAIEALARTLQPIMETSAAPLLALVGGQRDRYLVLLAALDWVFRSYEQEKEDAGYIDFDDQKLLSYELLQEDAVTRHAVQHTYDHVVVDEFQDLNELDFRLILVVAEKATLLVVGDDDQAIYGFRGTSPRYIIDLPTLSGRRTTTLQLRRNYRSPANIVERASALIRHNSYRLDKQPIPHRTDLCDIRVYNALTPSAEAAMIGDFIERVVDSGTTGYRNVAVLYRMNSQSLPLQLELLTRGIPYYCRKEDNILGHEQLPRVVAVLRFVAAVRAGRTPELTDFMQVVRAYFQYLKDEDIDRLAAAARRSRPPYLDALTDPRVANSKIGTSNVEAVMRELLATTTPLDTLVFVGERFRGVRGMIGSLEEAVNDQLPLGELGDVAIRFSTLEEFAAFMEHAMRRAKAGHTEDFDADSVRLLTFFRSKGAQFDTVILPSLNQGIIPHGRSPLEDERRLFYVAVTRTKRNLWMSYVKRVCNKAVDVSQFLKELDLPRSSWVG